MKFKLILSVFVFTGFLSCTSIPIDVGSSTQVGKDIYILQGEEPVTAPGLFMLRRYQSGMGGNPMRCKVLPSKDLDCKLVVVTVKERD